jgi:hypothetical protein
MKGVGATGQQPLNILLAIFNPLIILKKLMIIKYFYFAKYQP